MSLTTDYLLAEKAKEYDNCGCIQYPDGIIQPCTKHEQEYQEMDAEMEWRTAFIEQVGEDED